MIKPYQVLLQGLQAGGTHQKARSPTMTLHGALTCVPAFGLVGSSVGRPMPCFRGRSGAAVVYPVWNPSPTQDLRWKLTQWVCFGEGEGNRSVVGEEMPPGALRVAVLRICDPVRVECEGIATHVAGTEETTDAGILLHSPCTVSLLPPGPRCCEDYARRTVPTYYVRPGDVLVPGAWSGCHAA